MPIKTQENTQEFAVFLNLELGSFNLSAGDIEMLYFIEDIFSFSMVGQLIFNDHKGILEFGPFTGNETITIIYGQDNDIIKTFNVLKISSITQQGQTKGYSKSSIELFFVDPMYIVLTNYQFSKSWKNQKISKIINDISTNFLGVETWGEVEETKEELEYFYLPQTWKLNTSISWLLKRASGLESGQPGFCYFTNSKGMNLVTLEKLLSQKKLMTISDDDSGVYVFEDINPYLYNKILSWKISGSSMNTLDIMSGGVRFGYNSHEKNLIKNEYEYRDIIKDHTILGKHALFPNISESRMKHINYGETNTELIDNITKSSWIKQYNKQQMISIICRGNEERYAGGMIHINWPSDNDDEIYNKGRSGKYLIKSITHSFNGNRPNHYSQNIVLIKNGYEEIDMKLLEKSTKKNLG